jgi:hypothetical protein
VSGNSCRTGKWADNDSWKTLCQRVCDRAALSVEENVARRIKLFEKVKINNVASQNRTPVVVHQNPPCTSKRLLALLSLNIKRIFDAALDECVITGESKSIGKMETAKTEEQESLPRGEPFTYATTA